MLILLCTNCGPRINHDMCWGTLANCEMLSRKITGSSRGCWYGCDSVVSFVCILVCGGVGDSDRVRVFSQLLSSSFSLPLVDYVGVVTISCVNGGSVGAWREDIWLLQRNGEWLFCRGKCSFDHCLFQDDRIYLGNGKFGDDEVSRRLRDVQDKAAIKR